MKRRFLLLTGMLLICGCWAFAQSGVGRSSRTIEQQHQHNGLTQPDSSEQDSEHGSKYLN